jgi:hypothetical protein
MRLREQCKVESRRAEKIWLKEKIRVLEEYKSATKPR